MKYSLDDQLKEVKRELSMRKEVYPGLIARGKLTRQQANERYMIMVAVKKTIESQIDKRDGKQTEMELK